MIKNVLQYVQQCLSVMDSDLVDSIVETSESMQVAELLRDVYFELLGRQEWSFLTGAVTLTALGDSSQPTVFTAPDTLRHLKAVWYNVNTAGNVDRRELIYCEPDEFLRLTGGYGSSKQLVTEGTAIQYYVRTDTMPTYYTVFDGNRIVCDAFDSTIETTLVSAKISAYGVTTPTFTVNDAFEPTLPEHMVPLLQATLNNAAFAYFKQQPSGPDAAREQRQLAQARRREDRVVREHYYANAFGRR